MICCQELSTSSSLIKCQEMVREVLVLAWKNCRMLRRFQRLAFLTEFGSKCMTSILAAQQPPLMNQKICEPREKTLTSERQSGMGKNQEPCLFVCSLPLFTYRFGQDHSSLWAFSFLLGVMWPFPTLILVILLPCGAVNHSGIAWSRENKTRVSFRFLWSSQIPSFMIEANTYTTTSLLSYTILLTTVLNLTCQLWRPQQQGHFHKEMTLLKASLWSLLSVWWSAAFVLQIRKAQTNCCPGLLLFACPLDL